jgi:hypothetical protein
MSERIVRSRFCQFGLHDFDNFAEPILRNVGSVSINLCDVCFVLFNQGRSKGVDFTMEIIYKWAEERASIPELLNSISKPSDQAKICYYLNKLIETTRNTNPNFPIILNSAEEKGNFIQIVENNANITRTLQDITDKKIISNISFRLWAGCMDGAKMTRETSMKEGKEIGLSPDHRRIADEKIRQRLSDAIYKAGVEAALFFELIENNHPKRHPEGIPLDSSIKRYLQEGSKNKSIVTRNDLIEPA